MARPSHLAIDEVVGRKQLELTSQKSAKKKDKDLFAEVLLLLGYPLDSQGSQVHGDSDSGNTLYKFEHPRMPQPLLLCLDAEVDDSLAKTLRAHRECIFVCLDDALTDQTKARLYEVLKSVDSTFKVL